jgi:hypothetical protein
VSVMPTFSRTQRRNDAARASLGRAAHRHFWGTLPVSKEPFSDQRRLDRRHALKRRVLPLAPLQRWKSNIHVLPS